ncbi:MAG: hypothetical protein ABI760_06660 [Ferruginibacter sp.]
MKKLIVGFALLFTIWSCNQPAKTETSESTASAAPAGEDMNALFEKNLSSLKTGLSAFEKEDISGWAATVADSARWISPAYGAVEGKKEDWKKALEAYMTNWDSLKLLNVNFLPGLDSSTHQFDGSVRYYGEWNGVHKSGVKTKVNFYGSYEFNKENKVTYGNEFFDVGGLMNAVSGKK